MTLSRRAAFGRIVAAAAAVVFGGASAWPRAATLASCVSDDPDVIKPIPIAPAELYIDPGHAVLKNTSQGSSAWIGNLVLHDGYLYAAIDDAPVELKDGDFLPSSDMIPMPS